MENGDPVSEEIRLHDDTAIRLNRALALERERFARPMKRLTQSFIALVSLLVLGVGVASGADTFNSFTSMLVVACVIGMLVAMLFFYSYLGTLAVRLNRSPILWIGLTILTSPFGFLVAYLNMRSLVSMQVGYPASASKTKVSETVTKAGGVRSKVLTSRNVLRVLAGLFLLLGLRRVSVQR